MGLDLVNPYATRIVLAVRDGDSINRISKKAGVSYAYTHEWIERLEAIDVVERDDGVYLTDEAFRAAFESVAQTVVSTSPQLEDAYLLPNFAGLDYRYSKTDAVFIWTEGGYQIGRNRRDYPLFMDVLADDLADWQRFFEGYGLHSSVETRDGDGIYYVLFPREEFESDWVENASVMPLPETVEWAQQYEANFQPALELLDERYDLGLGVKYRERTAI